jgi:hypothetical protein
MPRKTKSIFSRLRFRKGARWARRKFARVPRALRIAGGVVMVLVVLAVANLVYQVIRKPTELFFFVGHRLDKEPPETWRQYGPLFRRFSTSTIPPELLAALVQIESSGNPVDRTYWRWRWSLNPFAIYQPASSAVGLTQMTDGAAAEAARFCIRDHAVTDSGCGTLPYIRALPSHSIELASIYLDRNVADVLARAGDVKPSASQKQDLAAFIHLCGGGPATAFARRKFVMNPEERCGDHLVSSYVARVNAMKRQFQRLAADGDP